MYTPVAVNDDGPSVVYIHGGGWIRGSPDSYDYVCYNLAQQTGSVVYSINYRLSPEYKFPIPLYDCVDAVSGILDLDGVDSIMLGGDSAGGNLALSTSLLLMNQNAKSPRLQGVYLIYPSVDFTKRDQPSKTAFGHSHYLTMSVVLRMQNYYIANESEVEDWRVSPLFAPDSYYKNLPKVLLIIAEEDPLASECYELDSKLRDLGIEVTSFDYAGQVHAFFSKCEVDAFLPASSHAISTVARFLVE
eukprot:TRINITY_DN1221_c0_g1_i2.p1 TRINITY_DN1221_c0_g1~~TRINITY_DN1221_c0_g1_i2.p1  ORF type:complete len:246 (+),score=40.97 TRINITY_DN1221_c0_g1_i2:542-1279(+)